MDDFIVDVYLREIATQCSFALNAANALDNVLPRRSEAARTGETSHSKTLHQEVFRTIHSLLTHSSNVSRLLWPAVHMRKKTETEAAFETRCARIPKIARACALRSILTLSTEGHVLKDRKLRDHLEHFDQRLDNWQKTSQHKNIVQDMIGPRGSIIGIDETDTMRWFDPAEFVFHFRGEEFDIRALVEGLRTLAGTVEAELNRLDHIRWARPQASPTVPPGPAN